MDNIIHPRFSRVYIFFILEHSLIKGGEYTVYNKEDIDNHIQFVYNETITGKINITSRWIILHSLLYYQFDRAIKSDIQFDMVSKAFKKLIDKYPDEFKSSKYYHIMYDFNGCTGMDIPNRIKSDDSYSYFIKTINGLLNN